MPVQLYEFATHQDARGTLQVQEFTTIPVNFKRMFVLDGAYDGAIRGRHAHKKCWLFMYSSGVGVNVSVENLEGINAYELEPGLGLLLPPYNWAEITFRIAGVKLIILASEHYDSADYIYSKPTLNTH